MLDLQRSDKSNPPTSLTSPTIADLPLLPIGHPIPILTNAFQFAIKENDIFKLTLVVYNYIQTMKSNLDFLQYEFSNLRDAHKIATQNLKSYIAASNEEHLLELSYRFNDLVALYLAIDQYLDVEESESNFMKHDHTNLCAPQKQATQILHSPAALPANLLNPQPTENFSGIKIYDLENEIDHKSTDTDQLIVREARSILTPSPNNQPTLNQEHPAMFDINNFEEGAPMQPDPSLNPGDKGLKSPEIPVLQKAQVPNLLVTPGKEGPNPDPGQIAKSKPCDVPNLREISTLSRYQDHFAMFDINKFSNPTSAFDADSYLRNVGKYPPSTPTQPVLKPPWNLSKVGAY